jgi:phospholipid transport system substrate-binding protein
MSLRSFLAIAISVFLLVGAGKVYAAAEGASAQVKQVLDTAMDINTRADLQGTAHRKERAGLVRQLISDNFLSGEMAQESLDGYWNKISQAQRGEFQRLFSKLFQDSYTRMVIDFLQKETIEYRPETKDNGTVKVPTLIVRANEHIPVDYAMVQKNGRWFIKDVEIDGVSIVDNYRSTFRRVIANKSFDTLLKQMELQSKAID